jgi:predicted phage tail protein
MGNMNMKIIGAGGGGGGGKGGGGGGGSARVAVESPDSLRSKAFANVLDLVSEGEIEGLVDGLRSVYLDGTPVQNEDGSYNFKGIEVDTRLGTQSQSYMPGFASVENELSVGVEVKYSASIVKTITNANVNAVRVTIGIPALTSQNTSNGDISGTTVQYKIQLQTNGGGYVDQVVGVETVDLGSGAQIGSNQTLYKSEITIDWAGASSPTSQSISYKLEASKNGGAWTQIDTGTFSGTVNNGTDAEGNSYSVDPSDSKIVKTTHDGGTYQFRIIKVSGNGTLSIKGSAKAATPTITISGKTTSRYERSHRIALTGAGPWDIRVVRLTADSTTSALQNKTYWSSYTEIVEAKLRYPNAALVGVRVDSSQFQTIPTRGYDMKLLRVKVPTNYDPITKAYTGSWDGTFKVEWTDNPAWCFYDIVTNDRYGLGGLVDEAQVDKWAMYQIGRYCDERVEDGFGGTEPRFTCNMYIQTRAEAYKVMLDFASIFRGMIYWSTGAITAVQDSPTDPVALFTEANVIDGKFIYAGSSLKARHTVALVTWNDPADMYRQKVEYVEDTDGIARYGIQQTEVTAIGCTSRGQANRVGRWLLYSERFETETVQFQIGLDGAMVRPGQIIKVADRNRAAARLGGRITSSTTNTITVDKVPALTVTGWTIFAKLPDGTVESRTIIGVSGVVVTVSSAFSAAPTPQGVWVISGPAVEAQTFRVLGVSEDDDTSIKYSVTAIKHEPLKYDAIENGLVLQTRDITLLSAKPEAPKNGSVTEYLYNKLTDVKTMALISWEPSPSPFVSSYQVSYKVGDDNFTTVTTSGTSLQLTDAKEGTYTINICAVNGIGSRSVPYEFIASVLGKTVPPADVTGIQMTAQGDTGLLQWDPHPDLDVRIGGQIAIRYSETSGTWGSAIPMATFPGNATSGTVPLLSGTYYAKAVDGTGNYSTIEALVVTNAANLIQFNAVASSTQEPAFAGAKTNMVVADGTLRLDQTTYIDSIADFDAITYLDSGMVAAGEYEFDNYVDTGAVYTSRVSASFTVTTTNLNPAAEQSNWVDTWADFDVIANVDQSALNESGLLRIYIATTDDNPALSPTWSGWRLFTVGDYTARAFKFKVIVDRGDDADNQVILSALGVTVDVPDRVESANNLSVPSGGLAVTFANAFFQTPAVAITAENMATGDYAQITAKTAAGFTIQFKNSAGTGVARTMDWIAKGFGYRT